MARPIMNDAVRIASEFGRAIPRAPRREYVDLVANGIIDPTKVVRIALENAVSAASVLLLTEAVMTEVPDKKDEPAGPHLE